MTRHSSVRRSALRGFSIVEFMVALLLGTILIGGAISVYLASSRSFEESERSIELLDSGRFALQILADTLRHAGFFAGVGWSEIDREESPPGNVADDCDGESEAEAYSGDAFLFAVTADGSGNALNCITDAEPGTDVLVVKSLVPAPISDADPKDPTPTPPPNGVLNFPTTPDTQTTYVLALNEGGRLQDGADNWPPPAAILPDGEWGGAQAWPYSYQVFYVRRQTIGGRVMHTLARKQLEFVTGTGMRVSPPEDLVRGVEDMRIRFRYASTGTSGIDSAGYEDDLGSVNGAWNRVGAVEVFLLVRSLEEDPAYEDEKTYILGDRAVTPNDNFWRLLVNQHIGLRNPNYIIQRGST